MSSTNKRYLKYTEEDNECIVDTDNKHCWVRNTCLGGIWSDGDNGGFLDCRLDDKIDDGYSENIANLLLNT